MTMTRARTAVMGALVVLLISACALLPGQFNSSMTIERDGRFAFAYKGEIQLLGMQAILRRAAEMSEKFEPEPCYDEGEEVKCDAEELKEQEEAWEERRRRKRGEDERMMGMFGAMLNGIDPDDPKALDKFAENLTRVEGWKAVRHVGEGVFEVDYAISGRLDRDFVFPTIPGYYQGQPIFHVECWQDGRVKLSSPAMADRSMALLKMMPNLPDNKLDGEDGPKFKPVDGTFTLDTDAEILTNNTDEGPVAADGRKRLAWTVDEQSDKAPETLLRLTP